MAGDFFQRQDRARRRSGLLVFYLVLAVACIAILMNVAIYLIARFSDVPQAARAEIWLREPWWMVVSAAVVGTVLVGSLVRWYQLRGGGRAIAEMVGARRIDLSTSEPGERRLVNVVEEMSIASGTPVPELYIMDDESGINAFVAGYKPTEAVMVVTRGALDALDRDELQGVVGHEYSHILNGDMRLNVRLMAIVAGILVLGKIGYMLLRTSMGGRRRSSGKNGGQLALVGLALVVLGFAGVFFGHLIKAAVSRQREFLADASSVQFTRNPGGIAGALWQIKNHHVGSLIDGEHAEDMSHMCFGETLKFSFSGLMATHPPIDDRIKAIDPRFTAKRLAARAREDRVRSQAGAPGMGSGATSGFAGASDNASAGVVAPGAHGAGPVSSFAGADAAAVDVTPGAVAASVGSPQPEHMDYAAALRAYIPEAVLDAAHDPERAGAVVFGLLLGDISESHAEVGVALLRFRESAATADVATGMHAALLARGDRIRLPVLELAIPALKRLDGPARESLLRTADELVRIDREVTLFEFVVLTIVRRHLAPDALREDKVTHYRLADVLDEVRTLLTLLARAGADSGPAAAAAFERAAIGLGEGGLAPVPAEQCRPEAMTTVLDRLAGLSPLLKRPVIEACVDCVMHDGKVTIPEAELLRALAACLDCPIPPIEPTVLRS